MSVGGALGKFIAADARGRPRRQGLPPRQPRVVGSDAGRAGHVQQLPVLPRGHGPGNHVPAPRPHRHELCHYGLRAQAPLQGRRRPGARDHGRRHGFHDARFDQTQYSGAGHHGHAQGALAEGVLVIPLVHDLRRRLMMVPRLPGMPCAPGVDSAVLLPRSARHRKQAWPRARVPARRRTPLGHRTRRRARPPPPRRRPLPRPSVYNPAARSTTAAVVIAGRDAGFMMTRVAAGPHGPEAGLAVRI